MRVNAISRRLMLATFALNGCARPLEVLANTATTPEAQALLEASAEAHGVAALANIEDLNVSYAGQWHALVGRLQPDLVDAGFRGVSEERLSLKHSLIAQAHTGPSGRKQVVRQTAAGTQGDVHVWFNGMSDNDTNRHAAAALVVDGYSLFLLGPMLLARQWTTERSPVMERAGPERIRSEDRELDCDILQMRLSPGLGFSNTDRLALYIDRQTRLMCRVRFTLDGLESTRGAIAEVDMFDHVALHGVRWPTRFHERLLRPLPLSVHDWRLTGLDVNRGLAVAELSGPAFAGKAIAPAGLLA